MDGCVARLGVRTCGLDVDPCGVGVLRISLGWVLGCVM